MSKADRDSSNNDLKRISKATQKDALPHIQSAIPQDPDPSTSGDELDLDAIIVPDASSQEIEALLALSSQEVRPLHITPQEERFPPLGDAKPKPPAPESQPKTKKAAPPVVARRAAPPPKNGKQKLYNWITALAILGILLVCGLFSVIWSDPLSALNPLPPATRFLVITATAQTLQVPTLEADPGAHLFGILSNQVLYTPNGNGKGCNWASIAGTVTDLNGQALDRFAIRISNDDFSEKVFSGSSATFGNGGYEFPIGEAPQAAKFKLQLFSPDDIPISDEIEIQTLDDCEQNVAIINWVQLR